MLIGGSIVRNSRVKWAQIVTAKGHKFITFLCVLRNNNYTDESHVRHYREVFLFSCVGQKLDPDAYKFEIR